jgi:hypothetical protein
MRLLDEGSKQWVAAGQEMVVKHMRGSIQGLGVFIPLGETEGYSSDTTGGKSRVKESSWYNQFKATKEGRGSSDQR